MTSLIIKNQAQLLIRQTRQHTPPLTILLTRHLKIITSTMGHTTAGIIMIPCGTISVEGGRGGVKRDGIGTETKSGCGKMNGGGQRHFQKKCKCGIMNLGRVGGGSGGPWATSSTSILGCVALNVLLGLGWSGWSFVAGDFCWTEKNIGLFPIFPPELIKI